MTNNLSSSTLSTLSTKFLFSLLPIFRVEFRRFMRLNFHLSLLDVVGASLHSILMTFSSFPIASNIQDVIPGHGGSVTVSDCVWRWHLRTNELRRRCPCRFEIDFNLFSHIVLTLWFVGVWWDLSNCIKEYMKFLRFYIW